jgi:hypothetical protein
MEFDVILYWRDSTLRDCIWYLLANEEAVGYIR